MTLRRRSRAGGNPPRQPAVLSATKSLYLKPRPTVSDLPIIQKTYDLIKWYVPILNRLPRDHKFALGERIVTGLYSLLEGLIQARYANEKLPQLQALNTRLEVLRHQTRLLLDFQMLSAYQMSITLAGRVN